MSASVPDAEHKEKKGGDKDRSVGDDYCLGDLDDYDDFLKRCDLNPLALRLWPREHEEGGGGGGAKKKKVLTVSYQDFVSQIVDLEERTAGKKKRKKVKKRNQKDESRIQVGQGKKKKTGESGLAKRGSDAAIRAFLDKVLLARSE